MAHPKSALFAAEYIPASIFVALLNGEFGPEWVDWEPETLRNTIATKFDVPDVLKAGDTATARVMSGIFAAKTLAGNPDLFASRVDGFEKIILGLNNRIPDFLTMEVASPAEINFGIIIAREVIGHVPKLSEDVIAYIRGSCRQYGVFAFPVALRRFEPNDQKDLRDKIRARAETLNINSINQESMLDVQAAKLYDIKAYSNERLAMAKEEMAKAK